MQSRNTRCLEEFRVHADDTCQPADGRIPYRKAQVSITRPTRLGDVRVNLTVDADQPGWAKQGHAVIVNIGCGVNFGQAGSDVTIVACGEF